MLSIDQRVWLWQKLSMTTKRSGIFCLKSTLLYSFSPVETKASPRLVVTDNGDITLFWRACQFLASRIWQFPHDSLGPKHYSQTVLPVTSHLEAKHGQFVHQHYGHTRIGYQVLQSFLYVSKRYFTLILSKTIETGNWRMYRYSILYCSFCRDFATNYSSPPGLVLIFICVHWKSSILLFLYTNIYWISVV